MFQSNEFYILALGILILVPFGSELEEQLNQELKEVHCSSCNHHSKEFSTCSKMPKSVDYEVFGRVQGVFFRKFTAKRAKELGLKGYVRNTGRGTVVGTIQGDNEKVSEMKRWLQTTGSPSSIIDKCEFRNEKSVTSLEYKDFSVQH